MQSITKAWIIETISQLPGRRTLEGLSRISHMEIKAETSTHNGKESDSTMPNRGDRETTTSHR